MVDVYADVVATAALLIALGTAARQIYYHVRWNRPVLDVTGSFGYVSESNHLGVTTTSWGFTIVATNVGESPTRLLDANWEVELSDGRTLLIRGTDRPDGSIELETLGELQIIHGEMDPAVPLTIVKFDAAEWEWHREVRRHPLIASAIRGRPVVTYVSRNKGAGRDGGNPNTTIGAGPWIEMDPVALRAAGTP